ncbi:MAG: SRPBCC family protein [Saprospiraceae bacterium]
MIIIEKKIIIHQPVNKIWKILYDDFDKIDIWLSEVYTSKKETNKDIFDRVCKTPNGIIKEKIIHKNPELYQLSYAVFGFPFIFKSITSSWQLQPINKESTEVYLTSTIQLLPIITFFIKKIIVQRVDSSLPKVLNDLKVFVETGKVSSRKMTYKKT